MNAGQPKRVRFATSTKGVRVRVDQVERVNEELKKDPELDWAMIIRRGIDLALAEREGRIQILPPSARPLRLRP